MTKSYSAMSFEAQQRAIVRSYANVYKRRGKLAPRFCEKCGDPEAQMHHPDYHLPLEVRWLCAVCHRHLHRLHSRFARRAV